MEFEGNINLEKVCDTIHNHIRENRGLRPSHVIVHPRSYKLIEYDIRCRGILRQGNTGMVIIGVEVLASYEVRENEILTGKMI